MSRVIAVWACGFILAACSMSMPSLDFFRGGPATEVLRIESEPPGADARTPEGQTCRTPCELTVNAAAEVPISFALQGYQPQTISVRSAGAGTEPGASARMQPNPVYAELTPSGPQRQQKKRAPAPAKKKVAAKRAPPPQGSSDRDPGPPPSAQSSASPDPSSAYPSSYPWPPPPPPQQQ